MCVLKSVAVAGITFSLIFLTACDSYKEPKSEAEWQAFCEAPDSTARIKAIKDEEKRRNAGSTCFHAPWKKFVPSEPRIF